MYLLVNFTCLSPGSISVCFPHLSGFKSSLNQLYLPHLDYSVLQMVSLFLFLICLICLTIFPESDLQCRQVLTSLLFIKFLWLLRSLKCTSWRPMICTLNAPSSTHLHYNSFTGLQLLWSFSCFLLATNPLPPLCFCSCYSHLADCFSQSSLS